MDEFILRLFDRIAAAKKSRTFRITAWSIVFVLCIVATLLIARHLAYVDVTHYTDWRNQRHVAPGTDSYTYWSFPASVELWRVSLFSGALLTALYTTPITLSLFCWFYLPSREETLKD